VSTTIDTRLGEAAARLALTDLEASVLALVAAPELDPE
jgi:hypothetical protein